MNKKRTVAWLLVIMLLCSMGVQAFAQDSAISYSDIDGHWAQKMIEEFTERGYLKGYIDGTFRPDYPVTRAEAGAFVSRLGFPETHPLIDYSDLIEGAWYYDGVRTATRTGFVHGYPDGTYRPDAFILRQEATKLASHFWGEVDMEGFQMRFTDTDRIADWAFPHMSKLVKMGLLDGYPDNTVRPENNLTRAEFVKLFYMILIEPTYANVTVRAVDADNLSNDIIEPKIVSREIGSTVVFDAPAVPSRWNLVGDATQTHVIGQGLEVVFKYRYTQPSGGGGSTPVTNYTLSLAIEPGQGGTVSGGGSYPAGTNVTLNAVPDVGEGFEFVGWYEGGSLVSSNSQFTYTMPAQNTTLIAVFFVPEEIPPSFNLTLEADPEEGGNILTGSDIYLAGIPVNIGAEALEGYQFVGWFKVEEDPSLTLVSPSPVFEYTMPAADTTLRAVFVTEQTPLYPLTLVADLSEGGTVSGGGSYPEGLTVRLNAVSAPGFAFLGWYQGPYDPEDPEDNRISENLQFNYLTEGAATLTAVFVPDDTTYTLTLEVAPGEAGTVTIDGISTTIGSFPAGTTVGVEVVRNMEFLGVEGFYGWVVVEDDGTLTLASGVEEFEYTMPAADTTLRAVFLYGDLVNHLYLQVIPEGVETFVTVSGGGYYPEGFQVSLSVVYDPDPLFFVGWFTEDYDPADPDPQYEHRISEELEYIYTMPAGSATLYAVFVQPF